MNIKAVSEAIAQDYINVFRRAGMTDDEIIAWAQKQAHPTQKDPATCSHDVTIGDNYGTTCQNCNTVLSGYGYWASQSTCIHQWEGITGPDDPVKVCTFCESLKE